METLGKIVAGATSIAVGLIAAQAIMATVVLSTPVLEYMVDKSVDLQKYAEKKMKED